MYVPLPIAIITVFALLMFLILLINYRTRLRWMNIAITELKARHQRDHQHWAKVFDNMAKDSDYLLAQLNDRQHEPTPDDLNYVYQSLGAQGIQVYTQGAPIPIAEPVELPVELQGDP